MNAEQFLELPQDEQKSQLLRCAMLGLLSVNEVTNRGFSKNLGYNALEFVDGDTRKEILAEAKEIIGVGYSITFDKLSELVGENEEIWGYKEYVDNTHGNKLTNHRNRYWLQVFEERLPLLDVGNHLVFRTVQQVMLHETVWKMSGAKEKTKVVKDCLFVIPKVASVITNRDKFFSNPGMNGGFTIQGIWEFYMPSDNLAKTLQCNNATGVFLLVGYCSEKNTPYPYHAFDDMSHVPFSAETELYTL
jgi:hypothetical protein